MKTLVALLKSTINVMVPQPSLVGLGVGGVQNCGMIRRTKTWRNIIVVVLLSAFDVIGQSLDQPLETYKEWVNGEIPIREAVVHYQSFMSNRVVSEDWFRFGIQARTFYFERLIPADPLTKTNLVRRKNVLGYSRSHVWNATEEGVSIAELRLPPLDLACPTNSPEQSLLPCAQIAKAAHTLGLTSAKYGQVVWRDDGTFTAPTYTTENNKGVIEGVVNHMGPSGPEVVGVNHSVYGQFELRYAYAPSGSIESFTRFRGGVLEAKWTFKVLLTGVVNLAATDGYVPSLFLMNGRKRDALFWTNNVAYNLANDGTFFQVSTADSSLRKRVFPYLIALAASIVLIGLILILRRKYQNNTGQNSIITNK